ncbi:helix-turn-helix domain-containing protein [[Eubacterium] hominis]|uniref:helix-turn-helix domain-containing protein n=1 Tax=[Eubacterium] hominis TaxID=2764325 RepID=UPI003A4D6D4C
MNHKAEVKEWATALILKRLRNSKAGSKQYELANELHMSRQYYGKLENARAIITKADKEAICSYYGMSLRAFNRMVQKEMRILTGEEKEEYATEKVDYVRIRDEKFHNE